MNRLQYFPVYLGLLASLTCAALAAYRVDPFGAAFVPALVFWALVYGVTLLGGWTYARRQSKWLAVLGNALAVLATLLALVAFAGSGAESAFVLFLIVMQAARNLTLATRRDLYFACVIAAILLLDGVSGVRGGYYLFYLVAFVLAMLFTFMAAHVDERLALARGGDRELLARPFDFAPQLLLTSASIVALAFLVFLFLPQPRSPGIEAFPSRGGSGELHPEWEKHARLEIGQGNDRSPQAGGNRPGKGGASGGAGGQGRGQGDGQGRGSGYQGFSDEFDPLNPWNQGAGSGGGGGGGGGGRASNEIILYLQSDRPLYLRGRVFDEFDGRRWRDSETATRRLPSWNMQFQVAPGERATVGQIVRVEQHLSRTIFSAHRPVAALYPAPTIEAGADDSLRAPAPLAAGTVYAVKSALHYVGEDERPGGGESLLDDPTDRYRALPDSLPARVRHLARDLAGVHDDDLSRATAIERHLRENYRYTFDTVGREPAGDVADDLLFGRGEGHCEIFATTMAVMLRAADIPARLVTGYPATRYDLFSGEFEIRRLDGHAWVEAYIDGAGWVTFEPTPGYDVPPRESPRSAVQSLVEHLRHKIAADRVLQRVDWSTHLAEWFVRLWDEIKRLVAFAVAALLAMLREVVMWLAAHLLEILVLVVAALASIYLFRRLAPGYTLWWWLERWRVSRAGRAGPRARVFACYEGVERLLARKGLPRPPAWTHRDYESRLGHELGWLRSPVALLTNLFGLARYSTLALTDSQARLAEDSFRDIATALRDLPPARRAS